jgi:hypothetical protein
MRVFRRGCRYSSCVLDNQAILSTLQLGIDVQLDTILLACRGALFRGLICLV